MKPTPGVSFLMARVAEEIKLAGIRREAHQAEARRRDVPFPDAVDPDALAAEGQLVDITPLARQMVDSTNAVRGFEVPVFATPAAGEAMERLGVGPVLTTTWWGCQREGMEGGLLHSNRSTRTIAVVVRAPDGTEVWFIYAAAQRPNGALYGVLYVRDEVNPVVTG